jgi:hypothetical protein
MEAPSVFWHKKAILCLKLSKEWLFYAKILRGCYNSLKRIKKYTFQRVNAR